MKDVFVTLPQDKTVTGITTVTPPGDQWNDIKNHFWVFDKSLVGRIILPRASMGNEPIDKIRLSELLTAYAAAIQRHRELEKAIENMAAIIRRQQI